MIDLAQQTWCMILTLFRKVIKYRLVHFVSKDPDVNDKKTQTGGFPVDEDGVTLKRPVAGKAPNINKEERSECVSENKKREEISPKDQSTRSSPREETSSPSL